MWRRLAKLFGGLGLVLVTMAIAFFVAMRTKYPPVQNAVRRFNRSVGNPRAMKTAGQPGAFAGVIEHIGRKSGTVYETPIGPFPTEGGFVIGLPYGTTPDWVKNVIHAGTATIMYEGESYRVTDPQVAGPEGMSAIPPKSQQSLRWFNVNDFLTVRTVESSDAGT